MIKECRQMIQEMINNNNATVEQDMTQVVAALEKKKSENDVIHVQQYA